MILGLILILTLGMQDSILGDFQIPTWDDIENRLPQICFSPTAQTAALAEDQIITCIWAHPGQYPPQESYFSTITNRCCFWDSGKNPGVFWAIGESIMTKVIEITPESEDSQLEKTQSFEFHQAELIDIQALDASTDAPVAGARVTMADAAVHFVSFTRFTDEDGYAVLPVIPGIPHVITMRADRYLPPPPFKLTYEAAQANSNAPESTETSAHIVELEPGIEIRGTVTSPDGKRIEGARLHVEIERSDIPGATWHSDLDLPRAIESFATDAGGWIPVRSSYSTSPNGVFAIQTLPRGKTSIYATHEQYAPSKREFVDTSDAAQISAVPITLNAPKRAYIRVEDEHHIAIPASLTIIDDHTGYEIGTWKTTTSGALEMTNLPKRARFQVVSATHAFLQQTHDVEDHAEITLTLHALSQQNPTIRVTDLDHLPIERATVSIAETEIQKKYPLCMGKTDKQGIVQLESCPKSFWISAFHPDFAHVITPFIPNSPEFSIQMTQGHEIHIDMVEDKTQTPITNVQCTLKTSYLNSSQKYVHTESFAATQNTLILSHRPEVQHHLTCTTPQNTTQTATFLPSSAPKKLVFPYTVTRTLLIMDAFSSPVPYARLILDDKVYETDETGQLTLSAPPQTQATVMHWLHGQTKITWTEDNKLLEIRLPDVPPENLIPCLERHHIDHTIDSAAILISHDLPELGLKRADAVEICHPTTLTIVRDGRRIQIPMK